MEVNKYNNIKLYLIKEQAMGLYIMRPSLLKYYTICKSKRSEATQIPINGVLDLIIIITHPRGGVLCSHGKSEVASTHASRMITALCGQSKVHRSAKWALPFIHDRWEVGRQPALCPLFIYICHLSLPINYQLLTSYLSSLYQRHLLLC